MIDLQNKSYRPSLEEIADAIRNETFAEFCREIKKTFKCTEKIEFSACSWEPGWNVKFKKAGKSLCTLYPREGYFRVLVVIGPKEKEAAETLLPTCARETQTIYHETKEGNGQKWLMIDIEDKDRLYSDALGLIKIRRG